MQSEDAGKQLKEEVALLGRRTPSRRFPPELKARIARWARVRMEEGASAKDLDAALDVPWESLAKWLRAGSAAAPAVRGARVEARLRPVRVVSSASGLRGLVVRTPAGFVVEGLDVAQAAELLSRLG